MWCLIYTAISEHYSAMERAGLITDEELEERIVQFHGMDLEGMQDLYVTLFNKPASTLED